MDPTTKLVLALIGAYRQLTPAERASVKLGFQAAIDDLSTLPLVAPAPVVPAQPIPHK